MVLLYLRVLVSSSWVLLTLSVLVAKCLSSRKMIELFLDASVSGVKKSNTSFRTPLLSAFAPKDDESATASSVLSLLAEDTATFG